MGLYSSFSSTIYLQFSFHSIVAELKLRSPVSEGGGNDVLLAPAMVFPSVKTNPPSQQLYDRQEEVRKPKINAGVHNTIGTKSLKFQGGARGSHEPCGESSLS